MEKVVCFNEIVDKTIEDGFKIFSGRVKKNDKSNAIKFVVDSTTLFAE